MGEEGYERGGFAPFESKKDRREAEEDLFAVRERTGSGEENGGRKWKGARTVHDISSVLRAKRERTLIVAIRTSVKKEMLSRRGLERAEMSKKLRVDFCRFVQKERGDAFVREKKKCRGSKAIRAESLMVLNAGSRSGEEHAVWKAAVRQV